MFEIARQAGSAGVDCKMLLWFTKRHCYYHRLLCHSLVLTVILLVTICTGQSWAKSKDCGAPCLPALLRWSFSEDAAGRRSRFRSSLSNQRNSLHVMQSSVGA